MTTLHAVRQNVGTILGDVWKWGISLYPERAMSLSDLAYSLGMPVIELKALLLVNGAAEFNGFFCFESQESCEQAIKMLEVKMQLDGNVIQPPVNGSSKIRLEVTISREDYAEMEEEHEFGVEDLTDMTDEDARSAWFTFLSNRGIVVDLDALDVTFCEENGNYKLIVSASI